MGLASSKEQWTKTTTQAENIGWEVCKSEERMETMESICFLWSSYLPVCSILHLSPRGFAIEHLGHNGQMDFMSYLKKVNTSLTPSNPTSSLSWRGYVGGVPPGHTVPAGSLQPDLNQLWRNMTKHTGPRRGQFSAQVLDFQPALEPSGVFSLFLDVTLFCVSVIRFGHNLSKICLFTNRVPTLPVHPSSLRASSVCLTFCFKTVNWTAQ